MSDLLFRNHAPDGDGLVHVITPESAGWGYVGFALYRLQDGKRVFAETGAREVCLVLVGGPGQLTAGGHRFARVGERGVG